MSRSDGIFLCPHCGAEVAREAKACPECGSDERTGWADDTDDPGIDLPTGYAKEEEFDYDAYVQREFGWDPDRGSKPPIPMRQLWKALLAFILIAVMIWWLT